MAIDPRLIMAGLGVLGGGRNPDTFNRAASTLAGAYEQQRQRELIRQRLEQQAAQAAAQRAMQQDQFARQQKLREEGLQEDIRWHGIQEERFGETAQANARRERRLAVQPIITALGYVPDTLSEWINSGGVMPDLNTFQPREGFAAANKIGDQGLRAAELTGDLNLLPPSLRPAGGVLQRGGKMFGAGIEQDLDASKLRVQEATEASQINMAKRKSNLAYYQGVDTQSRTRERDQMLPYKQRKSAAETRWLNLQPGYRDRALDVQEGTLGLNQRLAPARVAQMLGLQVQPETQVGLPPELRPFIAGQNPDGTPLVLTPRPSNAAGKGTVKPKEVKSQGIDPGTDKLLDKLGFNTDVPGRYRLKSYQFWKGSSPSLFRKEGYPSKVTEANPDSADYERFQQDQEQLPAQYEKMVEDTLAEVTDWGDVNMTWDMVLNSDEYKSMSDEDRRLVRAAFARELKRRGRR